MKNFGKMSNKENKYSSFEFRRFSISHSRSAMKVGTDGVLLGAWAPVDGCRVIWDVGSGSGLISLMLAQRSGAMIYGIELDHGAYEDMCDNFNRSEWADRLRVVEGDVNEVSVDLPTPDLIVCNPPFFSNSLSAKGESRCLARHESTLGVGRVIALASEFLSEGGRLALVAPMDRLAEIEFEGSLRRMKMVSRVDVATTLRKGPSRVLFLFEKSNHIDPVADITTRSLRDADGSYSDWYCELTKNYYLFLR